MAEALGIVVVGGLIVFGNAKGIAKHTKIYIYKNKLSVRYARLYFLYI